MLRAFLLRLILLTVYAVAHEEMRELFGCAEEREDDADGSQDVCRRFLRLGKISRAGYNGRHNGAGRCS